MNRKELRRFFSKVYFNKSSGCWEWTACLSKGYGRFAFRGKSDRAYVLSYKSFCGQIPKGLELDHLCRNRKCVNPVHLEAVTRRVNVLRGDSPIAHLARRTVCNFGHEFSITKGKRYCKVCTVAKNKIRKEKMTQEEKSLYARTYYQKNKDKILASARKCHKNRPKKPNPIMEELMSATLQAIETFSLPIEIANETLRESVKPYLSNPEILTPHRFKWVMNRLPNAVKVHKHQISRGWLIS